MTRAGGFPLALGRMLAYVTTAAPSAALLRHGRARWIEGIEVQGWRVREAGPRNFVLWRNHIRPSMPFRVLVAPNRDCGLTHLEFQAVLADLAFRASLSPPPDQVAVEAWNFWIERAERRLQQRIALGAWMPD